ncbi:MAG TPA: hypothetical protein IAB45_02365 [Candidatus Onthousia faecavium]|nr:hypothetical protein [Candidatus Onthousia faecavium]
MINKKLVSDFADIIGNIEIAIHLDSFNRVKADYEMILNVLLKWIQYYYANKNLDIVTTDESLKIHTLLEEIKWDLLPRKDIGVESLLTDNILIRYEVIIKAINEERMSNNGKR